MQGQTPESLYEAYISQDSRFDGQFFTGISTTGIYCRPVCRARRPLFENCRFFGTAAEAEQAGFRPCQLCRPELAPGLSASDIRATLADQTADFLRHHYFEKISMENLARLFGYSSRHIRRCFQEKFKVGPDQYLQTCRLLAAKNLLSDTDLPISNIAYMAGFSSVRRFNELFRERYRLQPSAIRKNSSLQSLSGSVFRLFVSYRPPYRWEEILAFLRYRAIRGVELVTEDAYLRTVRGRDSDGNTVSGWIQIKNRSSENRLEVTVSRQLTADLPEILESVKNLFDTESSPDAVFAALSPLNERFSGLIQKGTRVPGCFDAFETAVHAVMNQQISVKSARTLTERFVQKYGQKIQTPFPELTQLYPSPQDILKTPELSVPGVIQSRMQSIAELAAFSEEGGFRKTHAGAEENCRRALLEIRGIGPWTADYLSLRVLRNPDVLLLSDCGIRKFFSALPPEELTQTERTSSPWRSYLNVAVWNFQQSAEEQN